ncbi:hypothetical protein [Glycomyces tarimensis]
MAGLVLTHLLALLAGGGIGAGVVLVILQPRLADAARDLKSVQQRLALATRRIYRLTGHWPEATNTVDDPENLRGVRQP